MITCIRSTEPHQRSERFTERMHASMSPRSMRLRARNIIELTAKQRGGYLRDKVSPFDIGARREGIGLKADDNETLPSTLCSVGNITQKRLLAPTARPRNTLVRPCLLAKGKANGGCPMSTTALIKMLIICAAMLTIQLLAYFAFQPVPL